MAEITSAVSAAGCYLGQLSSWIAIDRSSVADCECCGSRSGRCCDTQVSFGDSAISKTIRTGSLELPKISKLHHCLPRVVHEYTQLRNTVVVHVRISVSADVLTLSRQRFSIPLDNSSGQSNSQFQCPLLFLPYWLMFPPR